MGKIIIERTWTVNNLIITKSHLVSELTGKKIANSVVYSVDEFDGDNLNCFRTLREAKDYARNY